MNHLLRGHAPLSDAAWATIEDEARQVLKPLLSARRLVDFSGPMGWDHSATNLGRAAPLDRPPASGVRALARRVLPLVELRAEFSCSRAELEDVDRGALDVDLDDLDRAAREIATAENVAVFHGYSEAGIGGIAEVSGHEAIHFDQDLAGYPRHVGKAVEVLRSSGIDGPYALALGPEAYTGVVETAEHAGVLLFEHLRQILSGPIVWSPGVRGAVVLSLRGGDFLFESGEDLSVGYLSHDSESVRLYLEESFSFRVANPDAAVALSG